MPQAAVERRPHRTSTEVTDPRLVAKVTTRPRRQGPQVDADFGYCELGDECRNPIPEAHERRVTESLDHGADDEQ